MKILNSKFQILNKSKFSKFKKNKEFLLKQIVNGKMGLHQLPEELTALERVEIRRRAVEEMTKTSLPNIGKFSFDAEAVSKKNCENLIGGVQIPLGIAGPIKICGKYAKGNFYLPLATTEGALIASVSRGCKAINLAGGARTEVVDVGMTRGPVFIIGGPAQNLPRAAGLQPGAREGRLCGVDNFLKLIDKNYKKIVSICEGTSKHLKLLKIEPFVSDDAVFLRFSFDTGLAMGMNMVTIATAAASSFIEKETGAKLIALSGNVCVDKKASLLNFQKGRGKKAKAEIILSGRILKEVLKTNAHDFYEVYRLKVLKGSEISGTIGKNAHIANIIAAIFSATGQDLGHIGEASVGDTYCEILKDDSLKVSVFLPDLPIGVVGGGTGLATQRECLSILGAAQRALPGGIFGNLETDSLKLAEIISGAVLAGEISLIAALASHDLARAHQRLGRGK